MISTMLAFFWNSIENGAFEMLRSVFVMILGGFKGIFSELLLIAPRIEFEILHMI